MTKLDKSIQVESGFAEYELSELLGQGGAGRVLGGQSDRGDAVAVKILRTGQVSADTRQRFKNETKFLARIDHRNIVKVFDHGPSKDGPFYVMRRYDGNLKVAAERAATTQAKFDLFLQILDGIEAAHFHGVIHRDLKPENILFAADENRLAIADFGIAHFTENDLATLVETKDDKRLANFVYAAPEQKIKGGKTSKATDIFALGLILHELLTGRVPHGQGYAPIADARPGFGFLDPIVARMLSDDPSRRYQTVGELKNEIQKHRDAAINIQRLDELKNAVVSEGEITDPLALNPPEIVGVRWDDGYLYITLDRDVNAQWIDSMRNISGHRAIAGSGPAQFSWDGNRTARVRSNGNGQMLIDIFKEWLPRITTTYRGRLETLLRDAENQRLASLKAAKEKEELRQRMNQNLKF